jgi:phage-related protein
MTAVKELFEQIPTLIWELWMKLVLGFFRAIANLVPVIRELFKYIPFTFCTFIGLVASPILGLGSAVSGLIPAGISVQQT